MITRKKRRGLITVTKECVHHFILAVYYNKNQIVEYVIRTKRRLITVKKNEYTILSKQCIITIVEYDNQNKEKNAYYSDEKMSPPSYPCSVL